MHSRFSLVLFLLAGSLRADVRLPALFTDHMMLQRERPARVWGQADPGEAVTVRIQAQTATATADAEGRWSVFLEPLAAGGPHELTVAGKNTLTIKDVLVGDVWIASGQSNMQWALRQANDPEKEIANSSHPKMRLFQVPMKTAPTAQDDVEASWKVAGPESTPGFSAVGYFFARHLLQQTGIPQGVIQTAWGGTPAESWISYQAIAADPALISVFADWGDALAKFPAAAARHKRLVAEWEAKGKKGNRPAAPMGPGHPWEPGTLYNAMIAPLTPFAIKGAIWYQGESNSGKKRSYVYRRLFPAMIQDWRDRWGQGDFPFFWVQLANFKNPGQWTELQEAQTMTLRLANTGQAVTNDIGNPTDIHPRNKQDVGYRLGLAARAVAYGEKIVYSGPVFRQATRDGSAMRVWFDHVGGGLAVRGGGELRGFTVAGTDGKFVPAIAKIEGSSVVAMSSEVPNPVHVRYAWADNPDANLINKEGLPAGLFRSDAWVDPTIYR